MQHMVCYTAVHCKYQFVKDWHLIKTTLFLLWYIERSREQFFHKKMTLHKMSHPGVSFYMKYLLNRELSFDAVNQVVKILINISYKSPVAF